MKKVVEVRGLTKHYGSVKAIDDVTFSLESPKIYGLLGRNGAGKTTIMRIITAQLFATAGTVLVFGEDPYENNRVLSQTCFIKDNQKYPDHFSVGDVLEVSRGLFPYWDHQYAMSLLDDFQLPLKRKVKKLSRGMLSAVGIIVGLASRAPLTVFDEPYLGLDAVARGLFYDRLIQDYAHHPRTIVLSTHLIDEVSRLLEHVIVIDRGKILLDEDADALRGRAFSIAGSKDAVERFLQDKDVIQHSPLGGLLAATVVGRATSEIRRSVTLHCSGSSAS